MIAPLITYLQTFPTPGSNGWTIERNQYNRWVVQGNLDPTRRSYSQLFADMLEFIEGELTISCSCRGRPLLTQRHASIEDPQSWGLVKPPGQTRYVPIEGADNSISLHVIGKKMPGQEPIIPPELEGIIEIYENLEFVEFYNLLHSMVSWYGDSNSDQALTSTLWRLALNRTSCCPLSSSSII